MTFLDEPQTLAEWRALAHKYFDRLWRYAYNKESARTLAYKLLEEEFGRPLHISDADENDCKQIIQWAKRKNRGGKRVRAASNSAS